VKDDLVAETDVDQNRRFKLMRRPVGEPVAEDFALVAEPLPALAEGEFLVRNHYASLDPAIRGWLDDKPSYMPPVALGDPVRATTVGRVAQSRNPAFAEGQWVMGLNAIEEYSVVRPGGFTSPIDADVVPPTHYLSILGAVGSLVGQIAKIKGCRTIGIAGGPDKCRRLSEDYGFDAAIDYRGKGVRELSAAIGEAAPAGVDVIFENVGGDILDAGLLHINKNARIAVCGLISEYNSAEGPRGTRNIWQLIVKTATMRGLLVSDYLPRFAEGGAVMVSWLKEGRIRIDEHIDEGIENTFPAFLRLFRGTNEGKMILKIAS
jgi:NADPH-dependent curcumin reductase CurA